MFSGVVNTTADSPHLLVTIDEVDQECVYAGAVLSDSLQTLSAIEKVYDHVCDQTDGLATTLAMLRARMRRMCALGD